VRPFYAGVGGYDHLIEDAENKHAELYVFVNRGSLFSISDHKTIGAQQLGDGSIYVRAYRVTDEDWQQTCAYDIKNGVEVKQALGKEHADGAEPLSKLVLVAKDTDIASRSFYMFPIGHRWEHYLKVSLIGDAAHLMPPYTGEGIDVAMKDAVELAQAIIRSAETEDLQKSVDTNVKTFKEEMFSRATSEQERSYSDKELIFFPPGAPYSTIHIWLRNNAMGTGAIWA